MVTYINLGVWSDQGGSNFLSGSMGKRGALFFYHNSEGPRGRDKWGRYAPDIKVCNGGIFFLLLTYFCVLGRYHCGAKIL